MHRIYRALISFTTAPEGRQVQPTLEQRGFELHGPTYMWVFSDNYLQYCNVCSL